MPRKRRPSLRIQSSPQPSLKALAGTAKASNSAKATADRSTDTVKLRRARQNAEKAPTKRRENAEKFYFTKISKNVMNSAPIADVSMIFK